MDFITNNQQQMRLDSIGELLVGLTTGASNKLDVYSGAGARVTGTITAAANSPDTFAIRANPAFSNAFASGADGSMITFGSPTIIGSIGLNKQAFGNIPAASLLIGATLPGRWVAITDVAHNPEFVVDGNGTVTINGGFTSIGPGGTPGTGPNGNAQVFNINGSRGTGTGAVGDILFSTGTAQASGTTIHSMDSRWWIKGGTGYLSDTSAPTSLMDVTAGNGFSLFRMRTTYTPASSSDTNGNTGDFSWDVNYIYVKTASGWKRMALSTF